MLETVSLPLPARLGNHEDLNYLQEDNSIRFTSHEVTRDSGDTAGLLNDKVTDVLHVNLDATQIISSPYTNPENWLNLQPLDMQTRLLAHALRRFKPIVADYATAPYMSSFDWATVFGSLRAFCEQIGIQWKYQEFHLVIFRSQLCADADRVRLGELDQKSHEEACYSGGLLHYWFGSPNEEMRNLATCIWRNKEDATAGGRGPWHRKARGAAREMYETISFHVHKLVVKDEAEEWSLEEYLE